MKFRKKRPSAEPWTHIGTGVHLDRPQTLIKLGFADSARKGHCWCFGTTRVGKTRIMEHIIEQDIRKKYSVVAIGREPYFFGVAYEVSLVVVQALIILAEVGHIAELVHLWRAQPGEGCEPLTQPRARAFVRQLDEWAFFRKFPLQQVVCTRIVQLLDRVISSCFVRRPKK